MPLKIREDGKKDTGRPTKYTKKIGKDICKMISLGQSLLNICKNPKMPVCSTVYLWLLDDNKKEFSDSYARARAMQAELMFDEILDIADDGSNDFMTITKGDISYNVEDREVTNRSRLRVDTRKWYLSKVLPKKFGDKIDVTSDGKALPAPIYGGKSTENI